MVFLDLLIIEYTMYEKKSNDFVTISVEYRYLFPDTNISMRM